jgi:hypothetical protein
LKRVASGERGAEHLGEKLASGDGMGCDAMRCDGNQANRVRAVSRRQMTARMGSRRGEAFCQGRG